MHELTARQRECLDVIRHSLEGRGYPPTLREIGNAMSIRSTNGVNDHLRALERKGVLRRADHKSRAMVLTDTPRAAVPPPGWRHDPTPGTFVPRSRCLVCMAVTFAKACAVCGAPLLEVCP